MNPSDAMRCALLKKKEREKANGWYEEDIANGWYEEDITIGEDR